MEDDEEEMELEPLEQLTRRLDQLAEAVTKGTAPARGEGFFFCFFYFSFSTKANKIKVSLTALFI